MLVIKLHVQPVMTGAIPVMDLQILTVQVVSLVKSTLTTVNVYWSARLFIEITLVMILFVIIVEITAQHVV